MTAAIRYSGVNFCTGLFPEARRKSVGRDFRSNAPSQTEGPSSKHMTYVLYNINVKRNVQVPGAFVGVYSHGPLFPWWPSEALSDC